MYFKTARNHYNLVFVIICDKNEIVVSVSYQFVRPLLRHNKDQSTDPNGNTSHTSGPFLLNESSTLDESVTIIKDQPSVSDSEVVDNRKSVEAT